MTRFLPLLLLALLGSSCATLNQPSSKGQLEPHLVYMGAFRVYSHIQEGGDPMKPELLTIIRGEEELFEMRLVGDQFRVEVKDEKTTRILYVTREAGYETLNRLLFNLGKGAVPFFPLRKNKLGPETKTA